MGFSSVMQKIYFERGIFITWYCSVGDCTFCYMSTQKSRIKDPLMARRTKESILAEVLLCKILNWKIEFVSAGYGSYVFPDMVNMIKDIVSVYGEKVWLNIGALKEPQIKQLKDYIVGVSGSIETLSPSIRGKVCPSKPLKWFEDMFGLCNQYGLKKAITIILGLGETEDDFGYVKDFIAKHGIDQVTFYRLVPVKGTAFENAAPITAEYFAGCIRRTKKDYPHLKIIAGSEEKYFEEFSGLIAAGADGVTKFHAIKKFGSGSAARMEFAVRSSGREMGSNMTQFPEVDINSEVNALPFADDLKERIASKLQVYLDTMKKSIHKNSIAVMQ